MYVLPEPAVTQQVMDGTVVVIRTGEKRKKKKKKKRELGQQGKKRKEERGGGTAMFRSKQTCTPRTVIHTHLFDRTP